MQRTPFSDTHGSTGPSSFLPRRRVLAHRPGASPGCTCSRHARKDLHFWRRPVPFWLTTRGSTVALLAAMQGDDRSTCLCWHVDFHRQGKLPPRHPIVAVLGGAVEGWVVLAKERPVVALCAMALAAPQTGATTFPVSRTRGEELRFPKLVRRSP
jgi:hypothetical protein